MANNEAIRETSEAIVVCLTPDVCKTPMGNSMVPVPYQIIAKFDTAVQTAINKVHLTGQPAFHMGSYLPTVIGDEAGVGGGLKCGHNKGKCYPQRQSNNVRVQGQWLVRHGDLFEMNAGSPYNTLGMVLLFLAPLRKGAGPQSLKEEYERQEKLDKEGKLKPGDRTVTKITDDDASIAGYSKTLPNGARIQEWHHPGGTVQYVMPGGVTSFNRPAGWPNPVVAPPPAPTPAPRSTPPDNWPELDKLCRFIKFHPELKRLCQVREIVKKTEELQACILEEEEKCKEECKPSFERPFGGICVARPIARCMSEELSKKEGKEIDIAPSISKGCK